MPDPNNVVLTGRGVAFMLIPKVANTSIKMAMLRSIGIDAQWPGLNHFMAQARANAHIFHTADKVALSKSDDIKIAFVRHPYARALSCYRDKVVNTHHRAFDRYGIAHGCDLSHFIKMIHRIPDEHSEQHFRSQYHELYHNGKLVPDFVGYFETIQQDWKRVQELVPLDLPDLPHANKSTQTQVGQLEDWMKELLAERYAKDFEAFGYDV